MWKQTQSDPFAGQPLPFGNSILFLPSFFFSCQAIVEPYDATDPDFQDMAALENGFTFST